MHDESILQRRITLAQLLELDSFREVMTSFASLHRVGIRVFDADGTKLVDVRVASSHFYRYIFEFPSTRSAATRVVTGLKNDPFAIVDGAEAPRIVDSFEGLRYVVMPLTYEGDLMGRLIFGPYVPEARAVPDPSLFKLEPNLEPDKLRELMAPITRLGDTAVEQVLNQIHRVVEVILFTSYRALLTSQMHIESITSSYHELQEKNRILRENNERLKELDKLKSSFLATVSHELRTPLTSVIGYSEMLLEGIAGDLNDEQRDYLSTIMEKGESLLGLISQLLDLSRIESGNMRMNRERFVVGDMLQTAVTSVLPQAQKKSIHLDVQIDPALPQVVGDVGKIRQVVVNLLGNAVKFTPEQGTVALHADKFLGQRRDSGPSTDDFGAGALFDLAEESFLRITVKDSGIGIPKEKLNRVFERFYQVDNTSTREFGGTGLGLSIVKSFVEAHKGEISVESDTDQGATFTILLPL